MNTLKRGKGLGVRSVHDGAVNVPMTLGAGLFAGVTRCRT